MLLKKEILWTYKDDYETKDLEGTKEAAIEFAEKELAEACVDNGETHRVETINLISFFSYYQLVSSPKISEIDKVIFDSLTYDNEEIEFAETFGRRLEDDVKKKLKIPLLVSPEKYDVIEAFARFVGTDYNLGIDVIGRFATPLPQNKEIYPIKLPPNTKWEDITIEFLDGHNANIKAKDLNANVYYKEMGFEDKKKRLPNKQWELLELLSLHKGELTWNNPDAKVLIKKKKQLLAQTLKAYFQINEDPFLPYRQEKAYKIRINLIPE